MIRQSADAAAPRSPRKLLSEVQWHTAVIFNRGSTEPSKGSASICQGFRTWVVKWLSLLHHTRKCRRNTQHRCFFCLKLRFCTSFCIDLLCWVKFWHMCILGLYYNVRFLCTTLFNSKALSKIKKKRRTYSLGVWLRNRLAIYLVNWFLKLS